jgi:type III secretion protein S
MARLLLVAVVQAATQLQEQTLQYTLKFFAIVMTLFITAALVASSLYTYTDAIFTRFPGLVK